MPEGIGYENKPKMVRTVEKTEIRHSLPKLKEKEFPEAEMLKKKKLKPKKTESHVARNKRKETGSAARRMKREKIKKEISGMGIFKELKKEQSSRSQ